MIKLLQFVTAFFVVLPHKIRVMKKILFVLFAAFCLFSCGHKIGEIKEIQLDEIKKGIVEAENKGLPMTIQKLEGVKNITIDSIVVVNNTDPYYGYLVTTWEIYERHENNQREFSKSYELYSYKLVQKQVNVEVKDIHGLGTKFEWKTNWPDAYLYARDEQLSE